MSTDQDPQRHPDPVRDARPGRFVPSRRQFLLGGAVAGLGAAAAVGADLAITGAGSGDGGAATESSTTLNGDASVPFFGEHQAGIATDAQAAATIIALDLHPATDRSALRRMMRVLTDDAARLTQGRPALADSEPELAVAPARLTVTFGFGAEFVRRSGATVPAWLGPLPAFPTIDALEAAWSDGDLVIQVAADDPLTVAHATRMLLKDSRSFASVRWVQHGFRRAYGTVSPGTTMRNLFGQVDGTANPRPGSDEFDEIVWAQDGWLAGGTSMVVRRIRMHLDTWDRLDRSGREESVGRRLDTGAPLTGVEEHDDPDFAATDRLGFPVIPDFSHLRRARGEADDGGQKIFRRGYNYDLAPTGDAVSESGLVFVAFQADAARQFVPIQQRLADLDLLNQWTTPIGSAVVAVPPGCGEGGYIGETILEA
jgi:dye decolorizing peroxidase